MSENQQPDAIREKLAEIAENCIERRLEDRAQKILEAARFKDLGDTAIKTGNLYLGALHHRTSLGCLESAAERVIEIIEICREFAIEPPDEITGAGWEPVTTHRGVGEGDEGLPDGEPAECRSEKSPAQPEPEPEPEYIDPADRDPRPPLYCL